MTPTQFVRVQEVPRLQGEIELHVRRDGVLVQHIRKRNTIVYDGRNALLYLLAQTVGVPGDWRITRLIPGTDATPPTVGDLAVGAPLGLSDQIVLTAPDYTISAASGELIITGTLDTTQANGFFLREIGLVMSNGELFARQIHPTVEKTAMLTVTYTWRIAVTT